MEVFFLLKRKLHKGIVRRLMADNYFHQLSSMEYAVGFICYVFVNNLNFFFYSLNIVHINFKYTLSKEKMDERWKTILHLKMNSKCRNTRAKLLKASAENA